MRSTLSSARHWSGTFSRTTCFLSWLDWHQPLPSRYRRLYARSAGRLDRPFLYGRQDLPCVPGKKLNGGFPYWPRNSSAGFWDHAKNGLAESRRQVHLSSNDPWISDEDVRQDHKTADISQLLSQNAVQVLYRLGGRIGFRHAAPLQSISWGRSQELQEVVMEDLTFPGMADKELRTSRNCGHAGWQFRRCIAHHPIWRRTLAKAQRVPWEATHLPGDALSYPHPQ